MSSPSPDTRADACREVDEQIADAAEQASVKQGTPCDLWPEEGPS